MCLFLQLGSSAFLLLKPNIASRSAPQTRSSSHSQLGHHMKAQALRNAKESRNIHVPQLA